MGRKCFCGSAGGAAPRGRPGPPCPLHPTPPGSSPSSADSLPGYGLDCAGEIWKLQSSCFHVAILLRALPRPGGEVWPLQAVGASERELPKSPRSVAVRPRSTDLYAGSPVTVTGSCSRSGGRTPPAQFSWPPSCIVPDFSSHHIFLDQGSCRGTPSFPPCPSRPGFLQRG